MAVFYISICLTLTMTFTSCHQDFTGHKVLDIKTKTEQDFRDLLALENEMELDIWKLPRHQGDSMHVHVMPHQLQALQAKLEELEADVSVWHDDVQRLIAETKPSVSRGINKNFNFSKYNRYDDMVSYLSRLASTNVSMSYLHHPTNESRNIVFVKMSDGTGSNKRSVVMDCGIHAREWISPAFCMYAINELLTDAELLAKFDWYIIPVLNPDGYEYAHSKNRLWRKNRHTGGGNCVGVDLNRNFGYEWDPENGGSTNPCAETYSGRSAFSEQESKSIKDLIKPMVDTIAVYVTVHSYGQMWLYPWGYSYGNTNRHAELSTVAGESVEALKKLYGTHYNHGTAAQILYTSSGGSDDWAFSIGIPFSYTLELRDTGLYGFLLPESQIESTSAETYAALRTMALHHLVQ